MSNQPDFIILGAMKAGTSNLRKLLLQHPEVYMSEQEIGYFSYDKFYEKGHGWYFNFFKDAPENKIIGEKSPNYYFHPDAPERIHQLLPHVKLIWILREPVKRAYSDYWFSIYRGREYKSFDEAVKLELNGKRKAIHRQYLQRSNYLNHIEAYLKYFPKENMYFVKFEEMKSAPEKVTKECLRFLGLNPDINIVQLEKDKNPTYLPKYPIINYIFNHLFAVPWPWFYNVIRYLNKKKRAGYPSMDKQLYSSLKKHFIPNNLKLQELTGLDLESWNK